MGAAEKLFMNLGGVPICSVSYYDVMIIVTILSGSENPFGRSLLRLYSNHFESNRKTFLLKMSYNIQTIDM